MSSFGDTQVSSGRTLLFLTTIVAGLVCGSLGVWQLGRLMERRERNRLALEQRDLERVDLTLGSLSGPVGYRPVRIQGVFDFDREFVIRGRLLRGTPGIQVVTPMRIAGQDTAVLVHRGFVPTPDAGRLGSDARYRESDSAGFEGVALATPDEGDGAPLKTSLGETWHRLDLTAMRSRLPYPVASYYVIVAADSTRTSDHTIKGRVLPIRIEPPALDWGPHLSYAIQWFLIGGAALGFGFVFVRRRTAPSEVPD